MSLFDRLKDLDNCTYCGRRYKKETLKALPNDDSPQLDRKYCERCYPIVLAADRKLPWNKK